MERRSFLKGAAILAASGLLAKIIGAAFRIPLTYVVGAEGMGLYQMAYPIYAFLLVASTSALPVAISKMVSENAARNDRRGAHKVFTVAFKILFWIGLLGFLTLTAGSYGLALLIGNTESFYSIIAIAPALFFVSLMSAFRGYFQGLQMMSPTAVSQLVEQAGRLLIGLLLAMLFMGYGVRYGAAGAILGVTLSSVFALIFLFWIYLRRIVRKDTEMILTTKTRLEPSNRKIAQRMLSIALPITVGASIMPLMNLADKLMVVNILSGTTHSQSGYLFTISEATGLYGILTAYVNPLVNMPSLFTIAIAMSLVPAISESFILRDKSGIEKKATSGLRITILIILPAMVGMFTLAEPIISFLYRTLSAEEVHTAASILRIASLGMLFLALIQVFTAILQSIDRVMVPVRNLFIGSILKLVLTFVLVRIPGINILGAAIGTVVCYAAASMLNLIVLRKYLKFTSRMRDMLAGPVAGAAVMAFCVRIVYNSLAGSMLEADLSLILSVSTGVFVYLLFLVLIGAIKREDMELIPAGHKIVCYMQKLKMLR